MPSASPFRHPWWVPFGGLGYAARYLDDWLIADLSITIRQKPDWETKYKQKEIVDKWKKEFVDQAPKTKFPNEVFEYTIRELQWLEKLQAQPDVAAKGFKFGPNDMILLSDKAVSDDNAKAFAELASAFENSIAEKDYHPGSDNLVVDLVHPSLFHLVYGRTKALKDGKLEVVSFGDEIKEAKKYVDTFGLSKEFQWLPAVMKLDEQKRSFDFASYINGLHPLKNGGLYKSIAEIFNSVIPGLNLSLSRYQSDEYFRITPETYTGYYKEGFDEYCSKTIDELIEKKASNEEWKKFTEGKRQYLREFPPKYKDDPETKPFELRNFKDLKVIVKLANIELTPEKPVYKGGSWHVEGTINEDIVATVLYYYDIENIEDSKLSFRVAFEDPDYEQDDRIVCEEYYGLNDGDPMTRYVGNVTAEEGRVVVFPNYFQHHVDAFSLKDRAKPGHRKILCFFLVDPHNKVVKGTDVVPPQNESWVMDKALLHKYFPGVNAEEITTMTEAEAKGYREGLITERKANDEDDEAAYTREFSLCEH